MCFIVNQYLLTDVKIESRYARSESIENLSGRTNMWKAAIPKAVVKPLGYGFCLGGAVSGNDVRLWNIKDDINLIGGASAKHSLHSGYVQALCDLGLLGFLSYIAVFLFGIIKAVQLAIENRYLSNVYIFICLSIFNIAESSIMSPLSMNVLFLLSLFVFSLSSTLKTEESSGQVQ
jgi:O-antigen ligase